VELVFYPYFNEYKIRESTAIGKSLIKARVDLVNRVNYDLLIDIGIGAGGFVRQMNCFGYDINPEAVKMLRKDCYYINPYEIIRPHPKKISMSFWDSLEHIEDLEPLLNQIDDFAFISMPIYKDLNHILRSKHFKPNEHCWYFTNIGLKRFMYYYGFVPFFESKIETSLGREDIESFIFTRHAAS
jgi:hypothetical protein